TLKTYRRLLKEARAFLRTFRKKESKKEKMRCAKKPNEKKPEHEAHNAPDEDPSDSPENPTTMDPDFPNALDGPPKPCTPLAITLFIYHKCGPGKRGRSLADQIHAAIAWYYDEMDGDRYRNWWTWDSSGQCWIGNPARSARVKSMLATIKKEHAHDLRNHSRAMSLGDMQAMHKTRTARLQELEGMNDVKSRCERAELVMFGALSSLAWIVWLRCGEIVNLRFGDLDLSPPDRLCSDGTPFEYMVVNVCKRKNWTVKDETELTGHVYHLYKRADQPAIDAYSLIKDWISVYTEILGRPLHEGDVLFPTINASARADPNRGLNEDKVRKLVRKHAGDARLAHADGYKSHCFRRGGAQYRFMYAALKERWTLSRIRWWGGWANSEQGDTLVKYLLDELFTYEEDHRNALQPNDDGSTTDLKGLDERRELQASDPTRNIPGPSATDDISAIITRAVDAALIMPSHSRMNPTTTLHSPSQHYPTSQSASTGFDSPARYAPLPAHSRADFVVAPQPTSQGVHATTHVHHWGGVQQHPLQALPQLHNQASQQPTAPAPSSHGHLIVPKIERTYDRNILANAWRQVIDDWEGKDPRRCPVPLRDWDATWHKKTPQAVVYHQRRVIAEEFINECHRNEALFLERYPSHTNGISALVVAITQAKKERNQIKGRASRNSQ
ncbi:hypothetical protein FA13DRAFT_1568818, partial [Coprinellus micaceus]